MRANLRAPTYLCIGEELEITDYISNFGAEGMIKYLYTCQCYFYQCKWAILLCFSSVYSDAEVSRVKSFTDLVSVGAVWSSSLTDHVP